MSGLTRFDVRTGPRAEPRSLAPPHAALPSHRQSSNSPLGLAASARPTQMPFFAVDGEPIVEMPPVPLFPAATVTTMSGFANIAASRFCACVSYVGDELPHEWFWMKEPLPIAVVIDPARSRGGAM